MIRAPEIADADYDAAADSLIVRVADAYFNVLTAIETLASSRAEERSVHLSACRPKAGPV